MEGNSDATMADPGSLQYCSYCGSKLTLKTPPDDDRPRPWCEHCKIAHYRNPTILVASFLHHADRLLWTRRGIEPQKGLWAFPAGFVECGESLQHAAARELREETTIDIEPEQLIPMSISSVTAIDQVYVVFRHPCDHEIPAKITKETQQWAWLDRQSAPWENMAHQYSRALVEQVYTAIEKQEFFMRVGCMEGERNTHQSYPLKS